MPATECQEQITQLLKNIFGPDLVKKEWSIRVGATDAFRHKGIYSPRLDVAVGPFNIDREDIYLNQNKIAEYREHPLIKGICSKVEIDFNRNPRCMLAIEIEFSGSSKHILGDFTNASMMGMVGIVVGFSHNIEKIGRINKYISLLQAVEKAPQDLFKNVVCFEAEDFLNLLRTYQKE